MAKGLGLGNFCGAIKFLFIFFPVGLKIIVQNLWESLWVSLWERCGKVLRKLWIKKLYTYLVAKVRVFHVVVEKFCRWFYTQFNRGKVVVLHSFHRAYYYNY